MSRHHSLAHPALTTTNENGTEVRLDDETNQEGGRNDEQATPERQEPELCPRIYVASLADYNAGRRHGVWIKAWRVPDEIHTIINEMLATSPEPGAEEFAIHDYEGFSLVPISEYDSIERVSAVASGIMEYGEAFAGWVAHMGDSEDALDHDKFDEAYMGEWQSFEAMAEDWLEQYGVFKQVEDAIPESLRPYVKVDVERMAQELEADMVSVTKPDGSGVWIFNPHCI